VARVTQIVQKVLKKKDALDEIHAHRDEVELHKTITCKVVEEMVDENAHIDSARTV